MFKKQGFTLIEMVVIIIVLGILSAIAVPKLLITKRDARISVLKATKGALESSFDIFAMQTYLPNAKITSCSSKTQASLNCLHINNTEIAFTDTDHSPILNPWPLANAPSIKQLLLLVDMDINNLLEGPYNKTLNYTDAIFEGAISNDFWIFPSFDGDWGDIEGFKCKIHYLPANNSQNTTGKSVFLLETKDC